MDRWHRSCELLDTYVLHLMQLLPALVGLSRSHVSLAAAAGLAALIT
jgi:hypothetical protein